MCAVSDIEGGTAAERHKSMKNSNSTRLDVRRLALAAMLTAIVVVLQLLGSFIRFGPFSVSLVLIPIVIGAALLGWKLGAWLGFVFAVAVLLSGDAAPFLTMHPFGTIVTVLVKSTAAGAMAGLVYQLLHELRPILRTLVAAIVCPVINTVLFLLGCRIFLWDIVSKWAAEAHFENVSIYAIVGLVGLNFVFELAFNCVLSPVIVRLVQMGKKESIE